MANWQEEWEDNRTPWGWKNQLLLIPQRQKTVRRVLFQVLPLKDSQLNKGSPSNKGQIKSTMSNGLKGVAF